MGKGDKKTKRGKIFRGSYGKSRPKPKSARPKKESEQSDAETGKKKKG